MSVKQISVFLENRPGALCEMTKVLADEKILDAEGKIDSKKIRPFLFDQVKFDYFEVGEICGKAWHSGAPLIKK